LKSRLSEGERDTGQDKPRVRAAQYVRMSTDHQNYSTLNQEAAIAEYAALRGFEIVRTYTDEGKSGLSLEGRGALRDLIREVESGRADYRAILVYDISRWGRFPDADQAAHLEYSIKLTGISIHYCAEQFENDGSMTSTVFKGIKRVMAGEYSRELSVKVFRGQCRLIGLGFRQGGPAGYGLRRLLVNERREPKSVLLRGEHKSIQTDRVILVPGPAEEIALIQRIYFLFTRNNRTESEIAVALNAEGLVTDLGKPWTRGTVHQILTNGKYAGDNIFNRTSFKLKQVRVRNQPDLWVRMNEAFEALVDRETFETARRIVDARSRRYSDDEMLDLLTKLLLEKGMLSGLIIDEQDDMPPSSAYRSRFGSLVRAYSLVGFTPERDYQYCAINRSLRVMHPQIIADTVARIEQLGGTVRQSDAGILVINEEFTASIVIARCTQTASGASRWLIKLDTGLRPDITVAIRMKPDNVEIQDYFLFPSGDMALPRVKLADENGVYLDVFRADTIDRFLHLTARVDVRRAA
jgi:DNA invertase Pin-like site-specific DNA recombinase